jgi:hypothetical protein
LLKTRYNELLVVFKISMILEYVLLISFCSKYLTFNFICMLLPNKAIVFLSGASATGIRITTRKSAGGLEKKSF